MSPVITESLELLKQLGEAVSDGHVSPPEAVKLLAQLRDLVDAVPVGPEGLLRRAERKEDKAAKLLERAAELRAKAG